MQRYILTCPGIQASPFIYVATFHLIVLFFFYDDDDDDDDDENPFKSLAILSYGGKSSGQL